MLKENKKIEKINSMNTKINDKKAELDKLSRKINKLQNKINIEETSKIIKDDIDKYIVQWFKNNYVETHDNKDVVKIKDVYDEFSESDYFFNLSKMERRKYNKAFFVEYFETNIFLRKFYKKRHNNVRNVLLGWTKIKEDQDD